MLEVFASDDLAALSGRCFIFSRSFTVRCSPRLRRTRQFQRAKLPARRNAGTFMAAVKQNRPFTCYTDPPPRTTTPLRKRNPWKLIYPAPRRTITHNRTAVCGCHPRRVLFYLSARVSGGAVESTAEAQKHDSLRYSAPPGEATFAIRPRHVCCIQLRTGVRIFRRDRKNGRQQSGDEALS